MDFFFQENLGRAVPEGLTILDFAEAEMIGWQWYQLNHMQIICTLLQKIMMPAPHRSVFTGQMLFLLPKQQCQSTEGNTEGTIHTQTHTQTFNGLFSRTTWVGRMLFLPPNQQRQSTEGTTVIMNHADCDIFCTVQRGNREGRWWFLPSIQNGQRSDRRSEHRNNILC